MFCLHSMKQVSWIWATGGRTAHLIQRVSKALFRFSPNDVFLFQEMSACMLLFSLNEDAIVLYMCDTENSYMPGASTHRGSSHFASLLAHDSCMMHRCRSHHSHTNLKKPSVNLSLIAQHSTHMRTGGLQVHLRHTR